MTVTGNGDDNDARMSTSFHFMQFSDDLDAVVYDMKGPMPLPYCCWGRGYIQRSQ